jgi:hypothetical protein
MLAHQYRPDPLAYAAAADPGRDTGDTHQPQRLSRPIGARDSPPRAARDLGASRRGDFPAQGEPDKRAEHEPDGAAGEEGRAPAEFPGKHAPDAGGQGSPEQAGRQQDAHRRCPKAQRKAPSDHRLRGRGAAGLAERHARAAQAQSEEGRRSAGGDRHHRPASERERNHPSRPSAIRPCGEREARQAVSDGEECAERSKRAVAETKIVRDRLLDDREQLSVCGIEEIAESQGEQDEPCRLEPRRRFVRASDDDRIIDRRGGRGVHHEASLRAPEDTGNLGASEPMSACKATPLRRLICMARSSYLRTWITYLVRNIPTATLAPC